MKRIQNCLIQFVMLLSWMLIFTSPAKAALSVEITQGMSSAVPIAIMPFANEMANAPGGQSLTQIIANDLQNSGEFRIVSSSLFGKQPTSVDQINFNEWRKKGVNDILVGNVENLSGNRYRISFQLVSVYNTAAQRAQTDPQQAVLLNQAFTASQEGLRQLAHHISDLIYQKLTGVRGIFSTKIAYILVHRVPNQVPQYALEVADEDGFNPQTLLTSPQPIMSPSWTPDGKQIAYVSFENFQPEIYLQNLQTGRRQLLSAFSGINGAPAFSPDGRKLALVLTRTGNPKLYVLDLSNKRLTQLTFGYSIDTEPAWAPDEKSLLFTSSRGGNPQIYQYTFATKKVQRLTFNGNYNAKAMFMPQEQNIVMMHREQGLFGIARQSLESGNVQVLTRSGSDESPSLAPNGKMIIYAKQYAGRGVLAMVSTNGRVKLRLPARGGDVQEPAWSPYF